MFYSWVIALFNIGALIGAVGTGLLIKYIPYWHLILLTLLTHTVGYILYALSEKGWIIMISKILSGIYIGGEMTLALSYFAETSTEYENIAINLGKKSKHGAIRRKLFAWHNVGVGIGYIIGPGIVKYVVYSDSLLFKPENSYVCILKKYAQIESFTFPSTTQFLCVFFFS